MNDEDDTDRWLGRRKQSSDDRALSSRRAARNRAVPAAPQPQDRDPEVTSPFELLERDADHEVDAVVLRSRRDSGDPATFGDVVKLAVALSRERSANATRNAAAEQVLQGPHKAMRSSRRYLVAAVIAAATSIGGAVTKWSEHAGAPDSETVRTQQLEHAIDRIDSELREIRFQLGRRSERERQPAGTLSASKGSP